MLGVSSYKNSDPTGLQFHNVQIFRSKNSFRNCHCFSDSRNKLAEDEEREGKTFVDFHAKLKGTDVKNLTVTNDSSSSKLKMYKYHILALTKTRDMYLCR